MTTTSKPFRILSRHIAPAVIALSLMAANSAMADAAGVTLINSKLATIPGIKASTTVATAKSNDLLHALCLALDTLPPGATGAQVAAIVESALQVDGAGKKRGDKDKIAGQVIATAIANNNITDASVIATVTKAVFNVNSGNTAAALTATGKAVALSGAIKAASPAVALAVGQELGGSGATEFGGSAAEAGKLLADTSKALGTSAAKSAAAFESFSQGFLTDELAAADRKTQAETAAAAVASSIPAAAGSILGGYIASLGAQTNSQLLTAAQGYVANSKLAKALGEVIAATTETHTDKTALFNGLSANQKDAAKALIAQGVLRAGSAADVNAVMDAYLAGVTDRSKIAATVATGNGDSEAKLAAIVTKLANNQDATKAAGIGAGVISGIGALNPESADAAITALIQAGTLFTTADSRNALGVAIAPKVKAYSAVGFMAAGIAELNITASPATANATAVATANAIMSKASKAATDVAYRTAALSGVADKKAFAVTLATTNPKFALNAAVGASLADESQAGDITAAVIPLGKTSIAKAPVIAAAVASAVGEERATEVAAKVGALVSETGTVAGKPLKVATIKTLATALGKAIQAKPGVSTGNRGDELGEIAALLTNSLIQAYGGNAVADAKKIAARDKAIIALGSAVMSVLSKKPVEESKALLADLSVAEDIAGSIALTIHSAGLPALQRNALFATGGALEKAFVKGGGKAGTPDAIEVLNSLNKVRNQTGNFDQIFEDGTKNSNTDLQNIFNDKETDKRNG